MQLTLVISDLMFLIIVYLRIDNVTLSAIESATMHSSLVASDGIRRFLGLFNMGFAPFPPPPPLKLQEIYSIGVSKIQTFYTPKSVYSRSVYSRIVKSLFVVGPSTEKSLKRR